MNRYFADLHIHLGRTESNLPIKITAAHNMTFQSVVKEASIRKGISLIGIIDAHSPPVQLEIERGLYSGVYQEHPDGGIIFQDTVCILGAEVECKEPDTKPFHMLAYFPTIASIKKFTNWLQLHMKNVQLSTQRLYQPVGAFLNKVEELGGFAIPAHIFTPFKSVYGSAVDSLQNLMSLTSLAAVELGLSSDTSMADQLSELQNLTFVTNSDAHSLPKIGREYNELLIQEPSFLELAKALYRQNGRKVVANFGLNPKLGKYYRTRCLVCEKLNLTNDLACPFCGSTKKVMGVKDRIDNISDQSSNSPSHRAPYIFQIPLEFIPNVGKRTIDKLLDHFGTEMNIIHLAPIASIAEVTSPLIAEHIQNARLGQLTIAEGGGGRYGKLT